MSTVNIGGGCCASPKGLTRITFLDGTQVSIIGLDDILAAFYAEGRQVNLETAHEILKKVETKNYIASCAREEYPELLLREYGKYVAGRDNR